jgi:hypothetical protein
MAAVSQALAGQTDIPASIKAVSLLLALLGLVGERVLREAVAQVSVKPAPPAAVVVVAPLTPVPTAAPPLATVVVAPAPAPAQVAAPQLSPVVAPAPPAPAQNAVP